jgi:uncharacterized protein YqeY
MDIKQQLEQDIKTAMLAGDKQLVTTLRGLKSAILYVEVANGSRDEGLGNNEVIQVLTKEAKKRQESADLYQQGGNRDKADQELAEKAIIEKYLPAQLTEDDINKLIDKVEAEQGKASSENMGKIIGAVKAKGGPSADGGLIARLVKERL